MMAGGRNFGKHLKLNNSKTIFARYDYFTWEAHQ